jgi:hypothetical protein
MKVPDNRDMVLQGRVQNGVIVIVGSVKLPEGLAVTVHAPQESSGSAPQKRRVTFPLVRSKQPGSVQLTAERVAEFLEAEELNVPARH